MQDKPDSVKWPDPDPKTYKFMDVPIDDPRPYGLYKRGDTKGLFQFESSLGQQWSKKIKPENIDDLSAENSLLRPGGLASGMAEQFAKIKNGEQEPNYIDEALRPILEPTRHTMCFQEQVLRICVDLAGLSDTEADTARRAMGKKIPEEMMKLEQMLIAGAKKKNKVSEETMKEIFSWIQKSVRYLFNACVTPDTVIETINGLTTLDTINIGDKINSPYGFVEVVNIYNNGIKEVFEITLESGRTIKSTMDHEYLCEDGEKHKLIDILENDYKIMCED